VKSHTGTPATWGSRLRRTAVVALACMTLVVAATGCGSSNSSGSPGSSGAGQSFSLRLSSDVPATSAAGLAAAFFAKQVDELTKGKVKIQVFPLSQLGSEATVLAGIQTGSIDFADLYSGSVAGQLPKLGLFSLPFLIRNEAGAQALFNSPTTATILDSLSQKGVKGLYVASNGPFELLTKKMISTPADLAGLKLRVNTDPISTAMLKALNATAVPLPSLQVYSALQQDVVSGAISAPAGFVSLKWFEVAKQLTQIEPQWDAQAMVMSSTTANRLPQEYQDAITKAGKATLDYNKQTVDKATQEQLTLLKQGGVQFSTPDKAPFLDLVKPLYSQFADGIGADAIAQANMIEQSY